MLCPAHTSALKHASRMEHGVARCHGITCVSSDTETVPKGPCNRVRYRPAATSDIAISLRCRMSFSCIYLFIFYGDVVPTDGAVQSRAYSIWQSTEEAVDKHGILIIKHN